ncbi:serine/threonine-protein phosphatase 7 long form homolog isoform X2 [Amaranthus tricolor]|uniref:serine/threonine-protein phosphatase 7 long form homolog isoform X2 n=1 Tax=Amaranthus tricolor TaxID=29722 RepID=UPI002588C896|nr:serine/threonine-protein phosphatase 7 long form homolog isoform X2 [Amaranthus tricolor]
MPCPSYATTTTLNTCLLTLLFLFPHLVKEMDPAAPGPQDPSVLTMQQEHRSTPFWDAQMSNTDTLGTRHPDFVPWVIDERIILYLELTRLYDFHLVAYGRVDRAIITALVERWRQETHTFHLPLALGYLYRRLCGAAHKYVKEIPGPSVILQL